MARVLIIDDEPKICQVLTRMVNGMGHEACSVYTLKEGLRLAQNDDFDLILLDLGFPKGHGLDILPELLNTPARPEVIIVTGSGAEGAELAFQYGAWDYVQKPFTTQEVSLHITRALQYRQEKKSAKSPVPLNQAGIVGRSQAMHTCLDLVATASATDASVLITGETGTGKELFARAIHANSRRAAKNFIVVDCGALPETLVESILFGHERGAFTGAEKRHEGLMEQTEGGTLFLDEIGDLPLSMQKTLLRALQEKRIRPLGAKQEVRVDFRLVAATNRDLSKMVADGTFREDLLYRIRAMEIKLPPLRERREDIQEIAIQKIQRLCVQYGMEIKGISQEFLDTLTTQSWPGNVRELINVLEHSLASAGEDPTLIPKHLPYQYRTAALRQGSALMDENEPHPAQVLQDAAGFPPLSAYRADQWRRIERRYLILLLEQVKGDREKACERSGLSQSQLYALLKKHNLSLFRA